MCSRPIQHGVPALLLTLSFGCVGQVGGADDMTDAGAAEPPSEPEDEPREVVAVVGETGGVGHKLRAAPNREAEVLAFLPDRAVLPVIGEYDRVWWPLRYRDVEGWAHEKHLEIYEDGQQPAYEPGFNFLLPWKAGTSWRVTQGHGGFSHAGLSKWAWDFGMPAGTPVVAAHAGVVRKVKHDSRVGGCNSSYIYDANYVTLDRGDGLETHYVHLNRVRVRRGDAVERGERIGTSGATGYACGAHLHFQVQLSPSGGGTSSGANQSVLAYFWDTGTRLDPEAGTTVTSRNNTADVP